MRYIVTAVLETVVLVVTAIIILLISDKLFHSASRFDRYMETDPKMKVTIAGALDLGPDTEDTTREIVVRKLSSDFGFIKEVPELFVKVLNIKIGLKTAKAFELYFIITPLAGLVCLIAGIGRFFAWFRGIDVAKHFEEVFVDKSWVYVDERGSRLGYVGEKRAFFSNCFVWSLMIVVSLISGIFLPFFIALNLCIGVVVITVQIIIFNVSTSKGPAADGSVRGKARNYSIKVEDGLFRVSADEDYCLMFLDYSNAVLALGILRQDSNSRVFSEIEAKQYLYVDDTQYRNYEVKRLIDEMSTKFSKKKLERNVKLERGVRKGAYTVKADGFDYKLVIQGDDYPHSVEVKITNLHNLALLLYLLQLDSREIQFGANEWNAFLAAEKERICSHLAKMGIR